MKFKVHFIREDLCRRCFKCVDICPEEAIIVPENTPLVIDPVKCNNCGKCDDICNLRAIKTKFYMGK